MNSNPILLLGVAWCALTATAPLTATAATTQDEQSVDPYGWETSPVEEQLKADATPIPAGQGAIFVPRLSRNSVEPAVRVEADGHEVASGDPGQRLIVPPGHYDVLMGSTNLDQAVRIPVDVTTGQTATVPVKWGGLRIEVVDEQLIPHRGSYELIRADDREVVGVGFGADTLQGEKLATWLLRPGLYRVVQTGSNYRARTDFATVYVPESGFARFRLVMDPDTSEFRGAGVMVPGEFASAEESDQRWTRYLVVGADGIMTHNSNVVGSANQTVLTGEVFAEGYVTYEQDNHHVSALGELEEGLSQTRPQTGDPLPLIKTQDRLRGDLLYTYYLNKVVGPYTRAAVNSQVFATDVLATEAVTVSKRMMDGTTQTMDVAVNDTFRVSDPFQPTLFREGLGINTRLMDNRFASLYWRVGLGLRQNLYGGAFVLNDDPNTAELEYDQIDSFNQEGVESTVRGVARLTGWVVYSTNLEVFADFGELSSPAITWDNTLALRMTEYLSLNYNARLTHEPQVVDATQVEQSVLLRASVSLF